MGCVLIELKGRLIYKSNIVFTMLAALASILVQIALWNFLYRGDGAMIRYMMGYVIYANVVRTIYSNQIYHILAGKILNGDFVLDLVKPVNIIWFSYLKSLGTIISQILLQTIPLLLIFSQTVRSVTVWRRIGLCFLALFLGHVLISLMFAIIGLTAFVFVEVWALRRLLEDTVQFFSGALLPVALFPGPLKKAAEILPFHYLYDFPLQLLLDGNVAQVTIVHRFWGILAWIGVFGVLLYAVYRLSVRFCVVQGG